MLLDWDKQFPGRTDNIFAALRNISPSQLADNELFDFGGLRRVSQDAEDGRNWEIEAHIKAINL
jgi:tRNA 2-thiocytidine biosynthesis protein TtcA